VPLTASSTMPHSGHTVTGPPILTLPDIPFLLNRPTLATTNGHCVTGAPSPHAYYTAAERITMPGAAASLEGGGGVTVQQQHQMDRVL
jgi:hypothetical protein